MSNRYTKKPITIQAVQFTEQVAQAYCFDGEDLPDGMAFKGSNLHPPTRVILSLTVGIETLEGFMTVSIDDWVIKGVQGEYYPCKPDIFEVTYDKEKEQT